jgi:hypothetical protein
VYKTHGKTKSPEYESWRSIKSRCCNPTAANYFRYGKIGITMCDSWANSFETFYKDMGPRPPNTTIDRLDNSSGYSKENCRWATPKEQSNNRTCTRFLEYKGEMVPLADLARDFDINLDILWEE